LPCGPIHMPTVEQLANEGLRYNEFHTTALCSPTRTALLSGRNHHMNNMGSITETATAFPGQTGQRPNSVTPLAEMLRLNGYSTAAFGKSHEDRSLGGEPFPRPDPTAGRHARASTNSTASSAARPTNGHRCSTTEPGRAVAWTLITIS
jgi:arylsulfatase A-like enzyme